MTSDELRESITLVMHFNRLNGRLMGGYLVTTETMQKFGASMSPVQVLEHMLDHPDMRCDTLRV